MSLSSEATIKTAISQPKNERVARPTLGPVGWTLLSAAVLCVLGVLIWQGITSAGAPDPTKPSTSPVTALFDIGVLVFREGLECVLVLAAIVATMHGSQRFQRQPIAWGAAAGFAATVVTWFVAVGILSALNDSVGALNLQAATGLVAIVVLLVVMNWFFHKVYWGGWITLHNRKKKELVHDEAEGIVSRKRLLWGLGLLGFSSFYREGFEVVLFLQTYRLQMGEKIVLGGAAVGLALSGIVAALTFVAHRRLPYRRMLVLTGFLLGAVLLLSVGEQAQEMQLAGWLPTTKIAALNWLPDWAGVWFSVFPTVQSLGAQALAAALVVGSYFLARQQSARVPASA